ncbi:MAG TPA: DUF6599 family protein [Acidobacteriota bacterium]
MKKSRIAFWLAAALAVALPVAASAPAANLAALFPELDGWTRDGVVEAFQPENLYEHIDGAAENFLAYGFQRLAVQNYADKQRRALSAEIYYHGSPENAFGIYGSEKPLAGDYLQIGAQGYYEEGVLNFISDAYYVKLNGFDLGAGGREILLGLARRIAAAIGGANLLPETLNAFPAPGRIANSERFIAPHFLGLDFLGAAFSADYERRGEKFKLFIMNVAGEEQARAMLRRYAALDKSAAAADVRPGIMTIQDPYNGSVRLEWRGSRIWGAIGGAAAADETLAAVARNLAGR